MTSGYSPEEVQVLRETIVGLGHLGEEEIRAVTGAVILGQCPPHLSPFWGLAVESPSLFGKLSADSLLPLYSLYAFFPTMYERLYLEGQRPQIEFAGRTRGTVAVVRFGEGDGLVIKPEQSGSEEAIARMAGDVGVGPAQYPALEGYLVEELVTGAFFTSLPEGFLSDSFMYEVGRKLGGMLAALHARNIYYNDATISDPEGRSHLIVQLGDGESPGPDLACRLIDFGVSVLLDDYPHLGLGDVYNLVRTTPEFRLLTRMGMREEEIGRFLVQYRRTLAGISRDEILARDLRFTEEGLRQAAGQFGPDIVPPFREGFDAGYGGS